MSDSQSIGGRTETLCSLPMVTDPVLSPAVDSASIDSIRVMFEHMLAGMARLETRMDDYVRRLPDRHTLRPDPEPPHDRVRSRPLEASLPFTQQFSAISVANPQQPTNVAWLGSPEGFRPNPSLAADAGRPGSAQQHATWDPMPSSRPLPPSCELPPTSRDRGSSWDLPMSTRSHQTQPWGLPPESNGSAAWDPWGNRFPDHQMHIGPSSWDQQVQRHAAPSAIADKPSGLTMTPPRFDGSNNPPRQEPDPPYNRVNVAMPYIPPSLPAPAPFLNLNEGFRPNPSGASNSMRSRGAHRLVQPETPSPCEPYHQPHSGTPRQPPYSVHDNAIVKEEANGEKIVTTMKRDSVVMNYSESRSEPPAHSGTTPDESKEEPRIFNFISLICTIRQPLGEGLERWRGFYQSVHPTQTGLSHIDMSSTAGIEPHSVHVYENNEGSRSIIRWAFDPGGVISPKLLFQTLFIVSWFPP